MKWSLALAGLALLGRCSRETPGSGPAPAVAASSGVVSPTATASRSLIDALPRCDVEHDGLFIDLGSPAVDARRDHLVGPLADVTVAERAGASFARIRAKRLSYQFEVIEPAQRVQIEMRALALQSRAVTVYVDERRLGTLTMPREEPRSITSAEAPELTRGVHTLVLRFGGGALADDDAYADIDWIRVGAPPESASAYAAPTAADIVSDVVLGGEARRALTLRAPSAVRCALRVVPGSELRTQVGIWGAGRGTAAVRVLEDGEAPVVVAEREVQGGNDARWTSLVVNLDRYADRVIALELRATSPKGGGRIAFGEPSIVAAAPPGPAGDVPHARVAILVIAAGLDRRTVPPWGPATNLPGIARLARDGVAFDRYRAPTTVASAVVASLLTGVSPRAHGLEAPDGRLDEDTRLLGERAREASVHAALFTGVPTTFPAFGFDRGWDRYEHFSPVKDLPATEPLSQSIAWTRDQAVLRGARVLIVVHLRGGHPPWDVTRDEVSLLPPEEYMGPIEPRGGATALANLRGGRSPLEHRLSPGDWKRLKALSEVALRKQDTELRRLLETLDKEGLYRDSLIAFLGDVATGDPPGIPYGPAPALREDVLLSPLIVKFPGGALGGTRSPAMATAMDVTRALVDALGLDAGGVEGTDLLRVARGESPLDAHPLIATLGERYSTRWGPWLLSGEVGRRPTLCLVEVDPACSADAFADSPVAAAGLWRETYDALFAARRARSGRPAPGRFTPDPETQSALKVFGY